jgi:sensor c-di-GMP phosphodiesterase-like protein
LRALPFDRIKIDKSFVMSMTENSDSAAIVDAITRLGESLSLNITAEGIEDLDTLERLKAMGCVKGQGWHYGKPLSAAQVEAMLHAAKVAGDTDTSDAVASVDLAGSRGMATPHLAEGTLRRYNSTAFG